MATIPTTATRGEPRRYALPLDEWVRWVWASPEAERAWAPILPAIQSAWAAAERESVGPVRRAALQIASPEDLPALAAEAARAGQVVLPLERVRRADGYRANTPGPPGATDAWSYHVALTLPNDLEAVARAWTSGDSRAIGELLGYPPCCIAAFVERWVEGRWLDPTWPTAEATAAAGGHQTTTHQIDLAGPPEANLLLRWIGVRLVPHLPCRFDCRASEAFGRSLSAFLPPALREAAGDLLGMPAEWSAWHGIAFVRTPIGQMSVRTDATAERLVVRFHGRRWPESAVETGVFPYARPPEAALDVRLRRTPEDEWRQNGFQTLEGMRRAHRVVLQAIGPGPFETVVDLGCGNGRLLSQVPARRRIGVECDPAAAAAARSRGIEVLEGDLFALWPTLPAADRVLLAPVRLTERRERLDPPPARLVVYAYHDSTLRYGSLDALVRATLPPGRLIGLVSEPGVAEAALYEAD